jgi:4-amino-4-deoxy-L-arabinose transferase-like glycosyltransferase
MKSIRQWLSCWLPFLLSSAERTPTTPIFPGRGASVHFISILSEWVFGHWFLMRWNDPFSTIFWARAPMLLITLLLGFVLYRFASRLGGPWGGLLCLIAYVTTPAFLVFGPLVITDIVVTLFC